MKAMILAAGKGTRLLPLTENKPKALIEVQGMSLLEHTIHYLMHFGIDGIVINIHHHASQIVDFIKQKNSFGIKIEFSSELDELLDTGGGLLHASWFFDDGQPFVLTSSDVITNLNLKEMYLHHRQTSSLVTLAVKHRKSSRDFLFDADYRLCGWQNNITGEVRMVREVYKPLKAAFSTIHILDPSIFGYFTGQGCFSIIDTYLNLAKDHRITGFEHDNSLWYECGRLENLEVLDQTPEIGSIYRQFHQS
jgi:NDP-sugar pyrophosphorylase family protein